MATAETILIILKTFRYALRARSTEHNAKKNSLSILSFFCTNGHSVNLVVPRPCHTFAILAPVG